MLREHGNFPFWNNYQAKLFRTYAFKPLNSTLKEMVGFVGLRKENKSTKKPMRTHNTERGFII